MNTLEDLKKALKAHEAQAFQLNYTIADDPELSGEEYHACRHYVDLCRSLGMDVEEQFTGQPTAFRAIAHRSINPSSRWPFWRNTTPSPVSATAAAIRPMAP